MYGSPKKRYKVTTDSGYGFAVAPNLEQDFTATAPNQRWVAPICRPGEARSDYRKYSCILSGMKLTGETSS